MTPTNELGLHLEYRDVVDTTARAAPRALESSAVALLQRTHALVDASMKAGDVVLERHAL
jgi:hypothetical protein